LDGSEQGRLMRRYTQSPEAYQLYLQAQYLWDNRNKLNREKMAQYYHEAIEKDPKFALAYVGLADLQITMVGDNILAYDEIKSQIANNLAKALELDPELAQARNLRAEVKYQFDFDWIEAEKEFKKAIELNPNVASIRLAYGWFLMSAGRFDEATKEMEKAQELDPHSAVINRARGKLLYFSHRFDEAIEHFKRIVEAEPRNPINHRVLAEAYEENGMYAEALREIGQAARANGADEGKITADMKLFESSGWKAYLEKRLERDLDDLKYEYVSPMVIAGEFLKVGRKDEALTWLDKAVETRASGIPNLKVDPIFLSLHSDPRFVRLLSRMNLTP
jgi:tetratricopeptide (TPR) repeat protein